MQICTSPQTDNHASTSPLSFLAGSFVPAAQPTASKHWRPFHHLPVFSNWQWTAAKRDWWKQTRPFVGPATC